MYISQKEKLIRTLSVQYDLRPELLKNLYFQDGKIIEENNEQVGTYRYFEEGDQYFFNYRKELQSHQSSFKPFLSHNQLPAFQVYGIQATPKLHAFLSEMMTNWMDDPRYKLSKDAGAFFQGGSGDPNGEWFLIEFWQPKGVQAWMDYLNTHYKRG
jgi:hypothetical protein